MATQTDVRRIALALPETLESADDFAFSVPVKGKHKGYAWVWKERVDPKKPRVPNPRVLAVRVANNAEKDFRMTAAPEKYVIDPHYNGYPAVLVHLAKIRVPELRDLLTDAWRYTAPKELVKRTGRQSL